MKDIDQRSLNKITQQVGKEILEHYYDPEIYHQAVAESAQIQIPFKTVYAALRKQQLLRQLHQSPVRRDRTGFHQRQVEAFKKQLSTPYQREEPLSLYPQRFTR